jgi:arabinose-5-phosphate isomerase
VKNTKIQNSIRTVFSEHAKALALMAGLDEYKQYEQVIEYILESHGHIIICGMGKSGHVGKKMAATFASTGTPSFFLHPSEAFHGDLGMITKDDVIILISNSGETNEVLQLVPSLKSFKNKIIAITNNVNSTLAKNANVVLPIIMEKEACPNNLAPTTSTLITMAIGDALAVALMQHKEFRANDFALYHPGGALGKKLLTQVRDVMVKDDLPIVEQHMSLNEVIVVMNQGRLGIAIVKSSDTENIVGIITDGDLRRCLSKVDVDFNSIKAEEIMTLSPKFVYQNEMLSTVETIMTENKISTLIVLDGHEKLVGLVQIYSI